MTAEESLDDLYENVPCGLLSMTPDGVVVKVNQTFLDWTGLARPTVLGASFTTLLAAGSQIFYETRLLPTLRLTGEVKEVAISMRRDGDEPLPVLVNCRVVLAHDDEPRLVRVAIFDATARQDYERELLAAQRAAEASESTVRVLQQAASAFATCGSAVSLAEALVASAREALAASAAAVVLVDKHGETFIAAGQHPLAEFALAHADTAEMQRIRRGGVMTAASVDEARSLHAGLAEAMIAARVEAFSIVPLLEGDLPVGALLCFFGRRRALAGNEIDLQVALARQATQVLARLRLQHELEALALHDQLTGLANRKLLRERLGQALGSAKWNEHPMALIMVDLDGFKAVNDGHGHSVGDSVLKLVAERLQTVVRSNDVVGRFGGDEFVIICENIDTKSAMQVAERIRAAVREPSEVGGGEFVVSASVGVAIHGPVLDGSSSEAAMTPERIFIAADSAMYRSKEAGKNSVTLVEV